MLARFPPANRLECGSRFGTAPFGAPPRLIRHRGTATVARNPKNQLASTKHSLTQARQMVEASHRALAESRDLLDKIDEATLSAKASVRHSQRLGLDAGAAPASSKARSRGNRTP